MKKVIFFIVLLACSNLLSAQDDFRPGYIISLSGDTTYGEIDSRGDIKLATYCIFRNGMNSESVVFKPEDISGYGITEGKVYISQSLPGKGPRFLEYLVNGKLSLYYYREGKGDHYLIKKEGDTIRELPAKKDLIEIDGIKYHRTSKELIYLLAVMTQEAPQVRDKIKYIDVPKQKPLIDLVVSYHNAVCTDEKCIVYSKSQKTKLYIQPVAGILHYIGNTGETLFEYGAYINYWLPLVNERIYIKTGFTISSIGENQDFFYSYKSTEKIYSENIIKLPVQIMYLSPGGSIRPEFSAGPCVYLLKEYGRTKPYFRLLFSGGLNIKLKDEIYLFTGANIGRTPFYTNNTYFGSYSFSVLAGLTIKL